MKKKYNNKQQILWNIVNSFLAGGLVFLGSLSSGEFNIHGICAALITSLIVCITKFSEYWKKEENEYSVKLFSFVNY